MHEMMGGGYNPTKAVLDAIGKRYLVEHWVSDDGLSWYDRYNDGWVEQFGIVQNVGNTTIKNITLPLAFRSSSYHINWRGYTKADGNANYSSKITNQTPQSFTIEDYMIWADINFYWEAKGFAANS